MPQILAKKDFKTWLEQCDRDRMFKTYSDENCPLNAYLEEKKITLIYEENKEISARTWVRYFFLELQSRGTSEASKETVSRIFDKVSRY